MGFHEIQQDFTVKSVMESTVKSAKFHDKIPNEI